MPATRRLLLALALLAYACPPVPAAADAAADRLALYNTFPTLPWQLERNVGTPADAPAAAARLIAWANLADPEFIKGMRLVLRESFYAAFDADEGHARRAYGLSRWEFHVVDRGTRLALDVGGAKRDDGAPVLAWQFHGRRHQAWRLAPAGSGFHRLVAAHSGKCLAVAADRSLVQQSSNTGRAQLWRVSFARGEDDCRLVSAVDGMELVVDGSARGRRPVLRLAAPAAGAAARWTLRRTAGGESPLREREDEVGKNHALFLLSHLLAAGCGRPGDTMPIAIALANNDLYARFDDEARREILADVVEQYRAWERLLAWRKATGFDTGLAAAPLAVKLAWADRAEALDLALRGDRANYLEYVTRPAHLDALRAVVVTNRLLAGPETAARIERWAIDRTRYVHFMQMILFWRSKKTDQALLALDDKAAHAALRRAWASLEAWEREVVLDYERGTYYHQAAGRAHGIVRRRWVNHQVALFRAGGRFRGDCGTHTVAGAALRNAVGLVSVAATYGSGPPRHLGHGYPLWYDTAARKWRAVQDFRRLPDSDNFWCQFRVPRWHHTLPDGPRGRLTTFRPPAYGAFVAAGIDLAWYEELLGIGH